MMAGQALPGVPGGGRRAIGMFEVLLRTRVGGIIGGSERRTDGHQAPGAGTLMYGPARGLFRCVPSLIEN